MPPDVLADLILAWAHPAGTGPFGEQRWHAGGDLLLRLWPDGTQWWYRHGQLHRGGTSPDRPAYIGADGSQLWYRHGQRHRDGDQPAYVGADGSQSWYRDGQRHRDGGRPAVVWADGRQEWWVDGKLIIGHPQ